MTSVLSSPQYFFILRFAANGTKRKMRFFLPSRVAAVNDAVCANLATGANFATAFNNRPGPTITSSANSAPLSTMAGGGNFCHYRFKALVNVSSQVSSPSTSARVSKRMNWRICFFSLAYKKRQSPGFTKRRKRQPSKPVKRNMVSLGASLRSADKIANNAQVCASDSTISTPGMIGILGKWP